MITGIITIALNKGEAMKDIMSRYVEIDGWIFEIKMVRAIRADTYGKPYNAIANISINNDKGYIDGLMPNENDDFGREDFQTFVKFSQQIGLSQVQFDRYKNNKKRSVTVDVPPLPAEFPKLKLVQN